MSTNKGINANSSLISGAGGQISGFQNPLSRHFVKYAHLLPLDEKINSTHVCVINMEVLPGSRLA